MAYDPRKVRYLCFADATAAFADDRDTPRAWLERCLEQVTQREPEVRAFVELDIEAARRAADESTARWRRSQSLSNLDGMPVGIKDCFDVRGLPTRVNSALFENRVGEVDAAHVDALRRGGAIVVGKTTTTELTMALPAPTCNPWDLTRTPGGSSSGSAAAVAACMLPVATGSQVRGSVIRPASICGVIGFKPTFGALNRHGGVDPNPSLNHLGLLGGTLTDVWQTAQHIGEVAGPDPGYRPLQGSAGLPAARAPSTLARQFTCGWPKTDEASHAAFERLLAELRSRGIEIVEPGASAELEAYEAATTATPEFFFDILAWELRWPLRPMTEARPDAVSAGIRGYIERAGQLSVQEYGAALARRDQLRTLHRALAGRVDAFITLAHIGPGQKGHPAVGTPWYNDASSAIGAPTLNLPLLSVEGMPLGVQLMGFEGADADLAAVARWLLDACGSPTIGGGQA
jgi:Asp-tRNA(Asn)/Glu-tRNA(Gln) amidotransferase A subunit family amidase